LSGNVKVSPSASAATESAAGAQKAQTTWPHARQWCVEYARAVSLPRTEDVQVTSDPQTAHGTHLSLTLAGAKGAGFTIGEDPRRALTARKEKAMASNEWSSTARGVTCTACKGSNV
jgi:hypothetical protein